MPPPTPLHDSPLNASANASVMMSSEGENSLDQSDYRDFGEEGVMAP